MIVWIRDNKKFKEEEATERTVSLWMRQQA
jgi:hypothetical protein